jgi:hypothetical protein
LASGFPVEYLQPDALYGIPDVKVEITLLIFKAITLLIKNALPRPTMKKLAKARQRRRNPATAYQGFTPVTRMRIKK